MSNENTASSYLRYLPPVLWEGDFPLMGQMLRVFEKILTGIDDNLVLQHGNHTHQAVEQVIAHLDQLFDPWHTPPQFLDWLASWVDLSFPTVRDPQLGTVIQVWDEYLRRKAISQIVQIYRKRGLKEGLNQYLNLYTLADKRPRIAVDNSSRILFTRPQAGKFAPVSTLVSQGSFANGTNVALDGLVAPTSIVLAPDGSLLVGDSGTLPTWIPAINEGVWQILPSGQYKQFNSAGKPLRIGPASWSLSNVAAIATDNATPWNLYVLDNVASASTNALYQLTSPDFAAANPLARRSDLAAMGFAVAMVYANGHLLILDRGASPNSGLAATPRIVDVQLNPFQVSARSLTQVVEPLSLTVLPNGNLLIGDGRPQNTTVPADIVLVNRSNNAQWIETLQLAAVPTGQNPLVAPVNTIHQSDTLWFVLDLGLKPYVPALDTTLKSKPFLRNLAESAVVYRIDLSSTPPQITRATELGELVHPTGMVQDNQGMLYITDSGEFANPSVSGGDRLNIWRALPHQFGVIVHFSSQRPTTTQEQRRIYQNISDIIEQEKPAHAIWSMVYGAPSLSS